jgi:hypothetical protein
MTILAHAFTMVPTSNLARSVTAYEEADLKVFWRPDPQTALMGVNDRGCVMVEDDPSEQALGSGPVFLVDDVSRISLEHGNSWAISPTEVPVGSYAAALYGEAVVRYLDLSTNEDRIPNFWFGASSNPQEFEELNSHGN